MVEKTKHNETFPIENMRVRPLDSDFKIPEQMTTAKSTKQIHSNLLSIRYILPLLFLLLIGVSGQAQWILINKDGGNPNGTAALEVRDTTKGILFPRLTTNQMNAISPNTAGLIIYNTDSAAIYFNNGSGWASISTSGATQFSVPPGSIISFGGDTNVIPAGFLLCDGAALDTTAFSELYAAIGGAWGITGSNFNLPDLRGRFMRGTDLSAGNDPDVAGRTAINAGGNAGDNVGSYQDDTLGSHTHSFERTNGNAGSDVATERDNGLLSTGLEFWGYTGGNETRPINANVNYIICYSSSIAAAGTNSSVFQGSVTASQLPDDIKDSSRITEADGTAKVQVDGSDNIVFTTNSNEVARINPSGFLGINTNSPSNELDVAGTAVIDSLRIYNAYSFPTSDGTNNQVLQTDGSGKATWQTPVSSPWEINGSDVYRLSGKVGVGTTTPQYNVHVIDSSAVVTRVVAQSVNTFGHSYFWAISDSINVSLKAHGHSRTLTQFGQNVGGWGEVHTSGVDGYGLIVGTRNNAPLILGTNNANRVQISELGYVGIGTTTPDSSLTVNGGIKTTYFTMTDGAAANRVFTSDANGVASWQDPAAVSLGDTTMIADADGDTRIEAEQATDVDELRFFTQGGVRMRIKPLGAVGINTTTPFGRFHVVDSVGPMNVTFQTIDPNNVKLRMVNQDQNWTLVNSDTGAFSIENVTNGTVPFIIDTSGNVGIGTTNPRAPLHFSNTNGRKIAIWSGLSNDHQYYGFGISPNTLEYHIQGPSQYHVFYSGIDAASSQELMRITGTGNVGIGTSTPDSSLTVNGGIKTTYFTMTDGATNNHVLTSDANGVARWQAVPSSADNLGNHTATTNVQLNGNWLTNDGDNEGVFVAANGRVGIGTNAPTSALMIEDDNANSIVLHRANVNSDTLGIVWENVGANKTWNLYQSTNDHLHFRSGGSATLSGLTDKVIFKNSGEVGIGTSVTDSLLNVAGGIQAEAIQLTDGAGANFVLTSDANGSASWQAVPSSADGNGIYDGNGSLSAATTTVAQGTNRITYTSSVVNAFNVDTTTFSVDANNNRVGIGTASPETPLSIFGDNRDALTIWSENNANEAGISFMNSGTAYTWNIYRADEGSNDADLIFSGGLGNADITLLDERMRMKYTGEIGIGTSTPDSLLTVAGGIEAEAIKLTDGAAANRVLTSDANGSATWQAVPSSADGNGIYDGSGSLSSNTTVTQAANTLAFTSSQTNGFSIDGNTFSVDASNNRVGIGTAAPTTELEVNGDVRIEGQRDLLRLANGASTFGTIGIGDGNGRFSIYENAENSGADYSNSEEANRITMTTTGIDFYTAASGVVGNPISWDERMTIQNNGNVGIGTSTPNAPLQFNSSNTNRKIVLYQGANNDHQFGGFGSNTNAMRYQVPATTSDHVFYAGTSTTTSNELMRIGGDGNVGIGINSPSSLLHLYDGSAPYIQLSNSTTGNTDSDGFRIGIASNNVFFRNYENGAIRFRTQDQNRLVIDGNGDVGVGTASPVAKLHVSGGPILLDNNFGLQYRNSADNGNRNLIKSSASDDVVIAGTNTNNLEFDVSGANDAMYIETGGNVGIGTTTPNNAKLHVSGGNILLDNTQSLRFEDAGGTSRQIMALTAANHLQIGNTNAADIRFNAGSANNAMVIESGGQVGINNITPETQLHILGGSDAALSGGGFIVNGPTTGENLVIDANEIIARSNGSAASLYLNEYITIRSTGEMQVGWNGPPPVNYQLEVNGLVESTGAMVIASDARFKKDIIPVSDGLNTILSLNPVSYDWKRDKFPDLKFEDGKGIGFIAQEVEKIIPEIVNIDKEGYYSLQYTELIPVLTEAIQELNELISAQKMLINNQKIEIDQLKASREEEVEKQTRIEERLEELEKVMITGEAIKQ